MSYVYGKAAEKILSGQIDLTSDNIKVNLIDLAAYAAAITGATNATPIVITSNSHGLTSGQRVLITGVGGNTAANGEWLVTVLDADTFSLQDKLTGANVAGNGAYTSGGFLIKLDIDEFMDDVPGGAIVAESANLSGKAVTLGVFTASDPTISGVSGATVEAVIVQQDSGTDSTSPILSISLGNFTPNGSGVLVDFTGIFAIC